MSTIALTHTVPERLAQCELTFLAREPIDHDRAVEQHARYCQLLAACGAGLRTVTTSPELPDAVFLEDAAIVLDELAIAASMGAASRRPEAVNIFPVLAGYRRRVECIELPATLEGGDVLRVDRTLFVGQSGRTNLAGTEALRHLVAADGYRVVPVPVRGCLHLKTACTALAGDVLLANPDWVDVAPFTGMDLVAVPDDEPGAANVLRVGDTLCLSASHPRTADRVARCGFQVVAVDISEFEKAEAGMTCLSLLLEDTAGS